MCNKKLFVSLVVLCVFIGMLSAQVDDTWRIYERNTLETDFAYYQDIVISFTDFKREAVHYSTEYPSVIVNITVSTRHDSSDWEFAYNIYFNPVVTILPDKKIVNYSISYSDSSIQKSRIEIYDNQNRLIELTHADYSPAHHIWSGQRNTFFYNDNNRIDSLITLYYANTPGYFVKYIYDYNSQGRKTAEYKYVSSDSVNWVQQERYLLTYTGESYPLNFSYHLNNPMFDLSVLSWDALMCYSFPGLTNTGMVDSVIYQEYDFDNEMWSDFLYDQYTLFVTTNQGVGMHLVSTELDMMPFPPGYRPPTHNFEFNQHGYLTRQYKSVGEVGTPLWSETINYTWENYVANEDYTETPPTTLSVTAYPNPFKSNLNIRFSKNSNAPSDIAIYNIKGQLVRKWDKVKSSELSWDGKDSANQPVSSGVYLLKAKQGKQMSCKKIIKL